MKIDCLRCLVLGLLWVFVGVFAIAIINAGAMQSPQPANLGLDTTVNIGNLLAIVVVITPLLIFLARIGPQVKATKVWTEEHEKWALEEIKAHARLDTALASLATAQEDLIRWLGQVDQRVINHLEGSRWDQTTERRKVR